ncbi:MAG TPA: hypothetical protein VIK13_12975 [Candidatus Limnocylindrales bacterium]
MTDKQRDPKAAGPEGATNDTQAMDDAALDIDTAPDAAAPWDQADESVDAAADVTPAAAVAAAKASRGARDRRPKAAPAAPPSVSAQAVHVNDRASAVFVLASIGVFVALFAWALLFGHGGFVTNVMATPTPAPTATPAASPSAASSPVASGSAAPSGSPAASPAASGSAAPSASASAAPAASAAPSGSPAPSPSAASSPSPAAS